MIFYPSSDFRIAFRKGDRGTDVGVLQLNLPGIVIDGIFGSQTEQKVREFQRLHALVEDGIAGLVTQQAMLVNTARPFNKGYELPAGMLKSIAFNESSFILANAGRHADDDGWDIGAFARSSGAHPAQPDFCRSAFSIEESADWTAKNLTERKEKLGTPVDSRYFQELASGKESKFLWQLAVLSHNWPGNPDTGFGGAIGICNHGRATTDDDAPAQWIIDATKGRLQTPRQWCMSYIAKATAFVKW